MEGEFFDIEDKAGIAWTKRITTCQRLRACLRIVFQNNLTTVRLAKDEKSSSGKRTPNFEIRLFYAVDFITRKEFLIKHCLAGVMQANYFSKLLVDKMFPVVQSDIFNVAVN